MKAGTVREGEDFGLAWGNKPYARQTFDDRMREIAPYFVQCIQYPGAFRPTTTLPLWDGSDPLDSRGEGSRR